MEHANKRWFHHNLSGLEAEKLLKEKGLVGSFLARPSHSSPGSFALSVRRSNDVTHIRIQNTDEYLDLYGGEKFASLPELVAHYMKNEGQLKEKNGDIIELKYPLISEDPTTERWFHGRITGKEAEKMLLERGKYGGFLVRESVHQPGSYVLSVLTGEQVAHIMIHGSTNTSFDVGGGNQFGSLKALIDFYTTTPMVEKNGGLVSLKQPFNATRFNVSTIDERVRQLEQEWSGGGGGMRSTGSSPVGGGGCEMVGFLEEFEELHQEAYTKLGLRENGSRSYNREKNRYKNILPFDHTQVVLRDGDPNELGSDYINANYISWPVHLTEHWSSSGGVLVPSSRLDAPSTTDSSSSSSSPVNGTEATPKTSSSSAAFFFNSKPRYIATQGTMSSTQDAFWRMIWQERTAVIVMITKLIERSRSKCVRYWPTEEDDQGQRLFKASPSGHSLRVRLLSERQSTNYTLRQLRVSREPSSGDTPSSDDQAMDDSLTVYHYHFTVWPDHGTPSDPSCVLDFVHDISARQDSIPEAGPIVVHCSAGIGRTGAFIVIDMLINYIKTMGLNADIDISRTIQAVREQRSGMVQTETQYRFIYKAVQQYVGTISKRIQMDNDLRRTGRDYTNINRAADDVGLIASMTTIPRPPTRCVAPCPPPPSSVATTANCSTTTTATASTSALTNSHSNHRPPIASSQYQHKASTSTLPPGRSSSTSTGVGSHAGSGITAFLANLAGRRSKGRS